MFRFNSIFFVSLLFELSAFAQFVPFAFVKPITAQANPTSLSLSQSTNYRTFQVSWTGGSGNGGAGGCKLQYEMNGSTWTDLTGSYNCDANASFVAAQLPTGTNWTNNFNATGVRIRLVRISDSTQMGIFGTRTNCLPTGASTSSTPDIDEDCNHNWDNSSVAGDSCNVGGSMSLPFGAPYNVGATYDCGGGNIGAFQYCRVAITLGGIGWGGADCASGGSYGAVSIWSDDLYSPSGTIPSTGAYGFDPSAPTCGAAVNNPFFGYWSYTQTSIGYTEWDYYECNYYYTYTAYY